jgi:hypothetical protein
LAKKVNIFLKNGILGGAFYENFEWVMLYLKPPLNSRAAKKVWRAALWPCLVYHNEIQFNIYTMSIVTFELKL